MMIHQKEEDAVVKAYKEFKNKFHRTPSIRELAAAVKINKSTTDRIIRRLIAKGVMSNEPGVMKSLILVK